MRILMVTSLLPNGQAAMGGAVVMDGQLRAMLHRYNVTLASLFGADATDAEALEQLERRGVEVHVVHRCTAGGARGLARRAGLARRWLRSEEPLRSLAFYQPSMQKTLDKLLLRGDFDLVQVEDNAMAMYMYPRGIPAVLTEHDVRSLPGREGDAWHGLAGQLTRIESRRWTRYRARIWQRFERVQVFSEQDAAALTRAAPQLAERVCINPFGVDLPEDTGRPGVGDGVVFVGGFRHPPNVDAALWLATEIMPLLRQLTPGVRLTLVGADPPAAVRALASQDVVITGRVPSVAPYLESAAVVVAPLRLGGGMRVKVLQAMARARAVVATPLATEGLLIGASRPPVLLGRDAGEIARATAELLASPQLRAALGERARRFVAEHHTWSAYAERLDAIYAGLFAYA